MTSTDNRQNNLIKSISGQAPYSLLSSDQQNLLFENAKLVNFNPGQVVLRSDQLPSRLYLFISGRIRLLTQSFQTREPLTLDLRGSGQLVGWVSVLRGAACEWVIASEQCTALSISSENFIKLVIECDAFRNAFFSLSSIQESYLVVGSASKFEYQS